MIKLVTLQKPTLLQSNNNINKILQSNSISKMEQSNQSIQQNELETAAFPIVDIQRYLSLNTISNTPTLTNEPLLDVKNRRESLYPILHQDLWEMYKLHKSAFWVPEEVALYQDVEHWETKLTDDERHYIKWTLAFFAGSDFIINENQKKDEEEVTVLEYNFFNADKIARENIHSQSYADLIETYIKDQSEKQKLLRATTEIPSIKQKAEWMRKYISDGSFVQRLVASSIMEGIFFSGSFCSIFWLRKRGLMPGLCDTNELISRDEGLHRDFACLVYRNHIVNKLPEQELIQMIQQAVEIEKQFCTEALPVQLVGMKADLMCQYIEYVADHLAMNLIGKRVFNTENPFDWMNMISMDIKADFFVHRPTAYAKQSVLTSPEENRVHFDADF
jgi:ribonucleoside-diphosphate reductase beta chain